MTDKQIIDRVNVKECKYYCNGKCERYEEFVEADYADYSVKCICEKENDLGTYDICDYQQLKAKEQEYEELRKQWEFSVAHKIILEKDYNVELNKYKQALTEIKEIAEACQTPSTCKDYCKFFDVCVDGGLPLILQKCEVLDEI